MIRPLSNRVLIRPFENSELSKGGVYTGQATTTFVADSDKIKQTTVGQVVAIGPGKDNKRGPRRPPAVPIGSYVCFSDTCGKKVEVDDEELFFITEDDIAGFIDEPTTIELIYRH